MDNNEDRQLRNKKLGYKLLWIVAGALLFCAALVPIYNLLCTISGLNGKTIGAPVAGTVKVDTSRWVTVQFTSSVMSGLGWTFVPKMESIKLHPGQIETVTFIAKNITSETMIGQAVPSVSPGQAAAHLKKIECFCFKNQSLKAGEQKEMPLRFYISPDLPSDVNVMTLSYTFFKATRLD